MSIALPTPRNAGTGAGILDEYIYGADRRTLMDAINKLNHPPTTQAAPWKLAEYPGPGAKRRYTNIGMLAVRMGVQEGEKFPFEHIDVRKVTDQKLIVLVVNKGDYVVIEDDASLFPSDKLVTQLRMLK